MSSACQTLGVEVWVALVGAVLLGRPRVELDMFLRFKSGAATDRPYKCLERKSKSRLAASGVAAILKRQ